jgi:hypothetical protein
MPIVWTDDLKEQIKSLWETNSASAIAVQLQSEGWGGIAQFCSWSATPDGANRPKQDRNSSLRE